MLETYGEYFNKLTSTLEGSSPTPIFVWNPAPFVPQWSSLCEWLSALGIKHEELEARFGGALTGTEATILLTWSAYNYGDIRAINEHVMTLERQYDETMVLH